jgi:two-component system LytT family sensor kinase
MNSVLEKFRESRALKVLAYFLVWTVVGAISASQALISYAMYGEEPQTWFVIKLSLSLWYAWAVLAPIIYVAGRRFPLKRPGWRRNLSLHVVLNTLVLLASVLLLMGVRQAFGIPLGRGLQVELIGSLNTSFMGYWTIVLVAHAVGYYQEGRARMLRTAELTAQLSEARLEALRAQLHPHFLFNTMHAISAFLREDPEKAETMLAELAELVRIAMDDVDEQTVPLEREMEFIRRYLSIQKARLGDRLHMQVDVGSDVQRARVPNLVLQPLVENAVEHGIAKRLGEGRLWIRAVRDNGRLCLEVADDGPGLSPEKLDPAQWRIGLRNTRDRLLQLSGDEQRIELTHRPEGGLREQIMIPLELASASEP